MCVGLPFHELFRCPKALLRITPFILSAYCFQVWQQSLFVCVCMSVVVCVYVWTRPFEIAHVSTRINNWLRWKYSRHCLRHDFWWMLRWEGSCLCVYIYVYVFALSKSNYQWKVAALLANAKCFVLLCSRLIGWLKYKTLTNALLSCNVWVGLFVVVYAFSCTYTVLEKGQEKQY